MIRIIYLLLGIVILFLPGFLVSFLLYSDTEKLDFWKRIAGSIGLSWLIDMVIVAILAYLSLLDIQFAPHVILAFCGVCGVLVFLKGNSRESFIGFWKRGKS